MFRQLYDEYEQLLKISNLYIYFLNYYKITNHCMTNIEVLFGYQTMTKIQISRLLILILLSKLRMKFLIFNTFRSQYSKIYIVICITISSFNNLIEKF